MGSDLNVQAEARFAVHLGAEKLAVLSHQQVPRHVVLCTLWVHQLVPKDPHSGNIQGTFREHAGNMQGTCKDFFSKYVLH